jgi:hypothetical protein
MALATVSAATQAVAQTPDAAKSTHFCEIAYGSTHRGKINSEPFTYGGMNGLTATIQYRATATRATQPTASCGKQALTTAFSHPCCKPNQ